MVFVVGGGGGLPLVCRGVGESGCDLFLEPSILSAQEDHCVGLTSGMPAADPAQEPTAGGQGPGCCV